jgi:hypothetical protein
MASDPGAAPKSADAGAKARTVVVAAPRPEPPDATSAGGLQEEPRVAFSRFLETMRTPSEALAQSPESVRNVLDAFLRNPHQHRAHVDNILRAYLLLWLGNQYPVAARKVFARLFEKNWAEVLGELDRASAALLASVQPVELELEFVRPRRFTSGDEPGSDGRAGDLALRARIDPIAGYVVAAAAVVVKFASGTTIVRLTPQSERIVTGTEERTVSRDQKQLATDTVSGGVGAEVGAAPIKVDASHKRSRSEESSSSERSEARQTSPTWAQKVLSSGLHNTARWTLFATPEQLLAGGFEFHASLLIPPATTELWATASLDVTIAGWGAVSAQAIEERNPV